jgi:hypothetical protein
MKELVRFIGFQENFPPTKPPLAQVNLQGSLPTTVTYDRVRHEIVNLEEYRTAYEAEVKRLLHTSGLYWPRILVLVMAHGFLLLQGGAQS